MSTRAAEFTRQRKEIEREIAAQEAKKLWDSKAGERAAATAARAEECRQLAKRLVTNPAASADLLLPQYDGRFQSAEEITTAITEAFNEFNEGAGLNTVQLARLKAVLGFQPNADISRVETWKTAWDYVANLTEPKDETVAVSVPDTPTPTPEPELRGREKEIADRKKANDEWLSEMKPVFLQAVDSLQQTSGLIMEIAQQQELFAHHERRNSVSRRPIPFTVEELRKSALQIWGVACGFKDAAEENWYVLSKDDRTADQFRRDEGIPLVNTYDPNTQGRVRR